MVCAPVRSIIPSLKLGDYLSVQAHKPCSISHLEALSQLAYNLFKFIDGFKVICQLEIEPLKGLANVQEIFSYTIFLVIDLQQRCQENLYTLSDANILEL